MSTCPETEADNKRTGRGIIVINVSEMSLCAVLQWPQGLDDKESRYITKRSIFLFILKSNAGTDSQRTLRVSPPHKDNKRFKKAVWEAFQQLRHNCRQMSEWTCSCNNVMQPATFSPLNLNTTYLHNTNNPVC